MIKPGDLVVAIRNGGADRHGRPENRPRKGRVYRVLTFYEMPYGIGCRLEGLDPHPYAGYFFVANGKRYFRKAITDNGKSTSDFDFRKLLKEKKDA